MGVRARAGKHQGTARSYPRTARVSALLHEVVADELERLVDEEEGIGLLTVTAVDADPDLRHATVYLAQLSAEAATRLEELRPEVQRAIARQSRMKRTPQLRFKADPAIESGIRVEEALHRIREADSARSAKPEQDGQV